jgi:4-hydroxybenzoate polyprenyltransferase
MSEPVRPIRERLWILARVPLLPFVLFLPILGFGWAHWDRALPLRAGESEALLLVLAAWTALQIGTMWLNAHLDRDDGPVLLGRAVPVPRAALPAGYLALVVAVVLGLLVSPMVGVIVTVSAILAVLYSHPRFRWKGHPFAGPAVNCVGYGLLSPLAGWVVVRVSANPRTLMVWLLSGVGVLGCYFAAQAFQREEDSRRGYRTLVVLAGPKAVLTLTRCLFGAGFLIGLAAALLGWFPRLCLLAAPFGWWIDRRLARWSRLPEGGNERMARGLVLLLCAGALFTIGLAYADYAIDYFNDRPVCGLATAGGRPE